MLGMLEIEAKALEGRRIDTIMKLFAKKHCKVGQFDERFNLHS